MGFLKVVRGPDRKPTITHRHSSTVSSSPSPSCTHWQGLDHNSGTLFSTTRARGAEPELRQFATPQKQPSYIPAQTDLLPIPFSSVPHLHHAFLPFTMRSRDNSLSHNKTPAKCSVPCSFGTLPCPHIGSCITHPTSYINSPFPYASSSGAQQRSGLGWVYICTGRAASGGALAPERRVPLEGRQSPGFSSFCLEIRASPTRFLRIKDPLVASVLFC